MHKAVVLIIFPLEIYFKMLYFQVSPAAGKTVGTSICGQHFRFTPNTPCHRIKGEREKEYKDNPPKKF